MATGQERLRLVLPAEPRSVGEARHAVAALAEELGMGEPVLDDVKTIVSEACANVVLRAYPDADGTFTLTVTAGEGELLVVVRDFGIGIDMGTVPSGDRESLRLGLALISMLSKRHELFRHPDGGLEVRMTVSVSG